MNGGSGGEMTLAFELTALEALAYPDEVFQDARRWSKYVGVVSDKPTYVVTNFTRKHRIRQDFFSGPRGKRESLESVKDQFDTDRHVFISDVDESELAAEVGWEFLPVEQAADAADWELGEPAAEGATPSEDERDDWP